MIHIQTYQRLVSIAPVSALTLLWAVLIGGGGKRLNVAWWSCNDCVLRTSELMYISSFLLQGKLVLS